MINKSSDEACQPDPVSREALLADMIDHASDYIAATDMEYRYLAFNRAYHSEFMRAFGVEIQIGMDLRTALAHLPDELETILQLAERALAGENAIVERELGDPSRQRKVYEISYDPLRDPDGRQYGVVHIVRDITSRVRSEEELARLTAQLRKRTRQLRHLAKELTFAEIRERRELGQFLHDDLQQVMVAAKLQLSGCSSRVEAPDIRERLHDVVDLLNHMIDASRSLAIGLNPPILDIGKLTDALAWLARWFGEEHRLRVELELEQPIPSVPETVKVLLFQAVRELLTNVAKHSGTDWARIRVCGDEQGRVRVEVYDAGQGFDERTLDLPTWVRPGLGLHRIRERLEATGGQIHFESRAGAGTRVLLSWPRGPIS